MSDFSDTVYSQKARTKPIGEGKFGAQLATFEDGTKAVIKVKPFATSTFRGIDKQTMPQREVAAYVLDSTILDFGVVPETLLVKWQGQEASAQEFKQGALAPRAVVPGIFDRKLSDWKMRIAQFFGLVNLDDMTRIVLLDLVMNGVDRHGKNVVVDTVNNRVFAIDNGLSFGQFYRQYRSVFHKYLFFTHLDIPEWAMNKLARVERADLEPLSEYLSPDEVEQTWLRIQFVLGHADRLAFKRMSQGQLDPNRFPSYEGWFKKQLAVLRDSEPISLVFAPA